MIQFNKYYKCSCKKQEYYYKKKRENLIEIKLT